ncbi:zinc-binding dehydrogenase [Chloroflexota bacterium]
MDVISLVERDKIKPVISEHFPLEQANEAFVKLRKSAGLGRMILTLQVKPEKAEFRTGAYLAFYFTSTNSRLRSQP